MFSEFHRYLRPFHFFKLIRTPKFLRIVRLSGTGPTNITTRRKLAGSERLGYQCKFYDANDEKFTKPYVWKHCDKSMEIGQTYEIHWPHSAAGACGTVDQYQTPFYDGVFCRDGVITDTAAQIGVQGQIFTVVNDEAYYYGELFSGMIVDGDKGTDLAMYTGWIHHWYYS